MYNVEIIGTGSYLPEYTVNNRDIEQCVDTSDQWIIERTGIRERRISRGEGTTELAVAAARRAIEDARIVPQEIDLIIAATVTMDNYFPSTACQVQAEIGASEATCFDISAACSGFIYSLSVAAQFIKNGVFQTALIIGSEVLSKIVDWKDRNTCVLFGDGAGAAIIRRGKAGLISELTGSDGTGGKLINCPAVPVANCFTVSQNSRSSYIYMNGRETYKYAVKIMPKCVSQVLEGTGFSLQDVGHIIPHQANARILEAVAEKLQVDIGKFYVNLCRYGNTSGASIPIALDEMSRNGLLQAGELIILVGFGAGFTYGAQLIRWTKNNWRE